MSRRFRYSVSCVLPAQFIGILDSIVCILCLGYWHPGWEFKWFGFAMDSGLMRWAQRKGK